MEITELFLEKYKELESVISLVYGEEFDGAAVSWLERKKSLEISIPNLSVAEKSEIFCSIT